MEHFYNDIQAWFNFQDIYSEMVERAIDGDIFVELGVWKGGSTAYMGVEIYNSKKNIQFDAIDCFDVKYNAPDGSPIAGDDIYEEAKNNLKPLIDLGVVNLRKKFFSEAVKDYQDNSISFCFLDGSHDYYNVKKDLITWLPKIKKGGIFAGHDYDEYHADCHRAVNDVLGKENVIMRGTSFYYINI